MNIDFNIERTYPGAEMSVFERIKLCEWLKDIIKPSYNILEIGTGVGGSTYYLSKLLSEFNPFAFVYTCDPSRGPSDDFLNQYKNVKYFKDYSNNIIEYIIKNSIKLSYLFFDGPEDPNVALDNINRLEEYIDIGCYFSMHDWEISQRKLDGGISTKSLYIREYIEKSDRWEKIEVLDGITLSESVGFCLYKFLK
jgi:hypothetical protein